MRVNDTWKFAVLNSSRILHIYNMFEMGTICRLSSVANPDPKEKPNFAKSGCKLYYTNPDPDLNLAHLTNILKISLLNYIKCVKSCLWNLS